jgi:hypothetical protein
VHKIYWTDDNFELYFSLILSLHPNSLERSSGDRRWRPRGIRLQETLLQSLNMTDKSQSCPVPICHTLKSHRERGGKAPPILNLTSRWRWVVNSILWMFYLLEKRPHYQLDRTLGVPEKKVPAPGENGTEDVQPTTSHFTTLVSCYVSGLLQGTCKCKPLICCWNNG